jgi:hypothetical protein
MDYPSVDEESDANKEGAPFQENSSNVSQQPRKQAPQE